MTDVPNHQTWLARAIAAGHAEIAGEGRSERIRYIAGEIAPRREQARRLRAAAEAGWEGAKRWFEGSCWE